MEHPLRHCERGHTRNHKQPWSHSLMLDRHRGGKIHPDLKTCLNIPLSISVRHRHHPRCNLLPSTLLPTPTQMSHSHKINTITWLSSSPVRIHTGILSHPPFTQPRPHPAQPVREEAPPHLPSPPSSIPHVSHRFPQHPGTLPPYPHERPVLVNLRRRHGNARLQRVRPLVVNPPRRRHPRVPVETFQEGRVMLDYGDSRFQLDLVRGRDRLRH